MRSGTRARLPGHIQAQTANVTRGQRVAHGTVVKQPAARHIHDADSPLAGCQESLPDQTLGLGTLGARQHHYVGVGQQAQQIRPPRSILCVPHHANSHTRPAC